MTDASQLSLDDWLPGQRPPRARRSDPSSSHATATRMERSGAINRQCREVLALVREYPGLTARHYDVMMRDSGRWNRVAGRRLPELETKGLVRRGVAEGPKEIRWYPVREVA